MKLFNSRAAPPLLFFAAVLTQLAVLPSGYVGREHDDALYVLASMALRWGEYHYWFMPVYIPIDMTPGFPALLVPVAFFFTENLAAYQFYAFILLAACDWAVLQWLKTRHTAAVAYLLACLFALNSLTLSRAGVVMPEASFLCAVLLLLLGWQRRLPPWAMGCLALFIYMIRPAGVVMLAALGLATWRRDGLRNLFKTLLVPALGIAAWTLWCRHLGGIQESRELALFYGADSLARVLNTAFSNIRFMAVSWGTTFLPLLWSKSLGLALAVGAPLWLLSLRGVFKSWPAWKNLTDPLPLFFLGTVLMHVFWPWWYNRYLLVLTPFLLSFAVEGLPEALKQRPRAFLAGLAAALIIPFSWQGRFWLGKNVVPTEPDLPKTYEWILSNAKPSDVFASIFFGRDALHTGRIFTPLITNGEKTPFLQNLAALRATHVLLYDPGNVGVSDMNLSSAAPAVKRIDKFLLEDGFSIVYVDAEEGTKVFKRVKP